VELRRRQQGGRKRQGRERMRGCKDQAGVKEKQDDPLKVLKAEWVFWENYRPILR